MKRPNRITTAAVLVLAAACCSCNSVPEQPPLNEGYDTSFIMPEAEVLSEEDRAIITEMEDEYDKNFNK